MNGRSQPTLPVEPWTVREPQLDLERLGQMKSLFALSNGHIHCRIRKVTTGIPSRVRRSSTSPPAS